MNIGSVKGAINRGTRMVGGLGRGNSRASAAGAAAARQARNSSTYHLGQGGNFSTATAARISAANSARKQARDAELLRMGKKRMATGGGIIAGGAITANPKSNQSRTASFGNNIRRTANSPIVSPMGSGRYS
jgi:hypothetical protein